MHKSSFAPSQFVRREYGSVTVFSPFFVLSLLHAPLFSWSDYKHACVYLAFWQKLLLTSQACPFSTPVLSANIVIHHAVVHYTPPTPRSPALIFTYTLQAACLTCLHPSRPPLTHLRLLILLSHFPVLYRPPAAPPISTSFPTPSHPKILPLASSICSPSSSVYLSECAWVIGAFSGEKESSLPWVSDPCQGDKLPTADCLHSWKIKNLWGQEGSVFVCGCVTGSGKCS